MNPSTYPGIVADPLHDPVGSSGIAVHNASPIRTWKSASSVASTCKVSGLTTALLPKQTAGRARHGTAVFEDVPNRQLVDQLAVRASEPERAVWKIQPIVEVCGAIDYPIWRKARERAWKRDGNRYSTQTWPARIAEGELAAVLLMQSHGGHWRRQPAEIAVPSFARGFPARGDDIEHPFEPLALALIIRRMNLAVADERHTALLAPPLIDLIGRVPKPRTPRDLGIHWTLEPSEPHIRPRRR